MWSDSHCTMDSQVQFFAALISLLWMVFSSGMQGPLPVFVCSGLLAPLSVAVWHKFTQQDDAASLHLAHLPIHVSFLSWLRSLYGLALVQVVVFVAVCCVHWLTSNPHPHPLLSTVETLLEVSSAVIFWSSLIPVYGLCWTRANSNGSFSQWPIRSPR